MAKMRMQRVVFGLQSRSFALALLYLLFHAKARFFQAQSDCSDSILRSKREYLESSLVDRVGGQGQCHPSPGD